MKPTLKFVGEALLIAALIPVVFYLCMFLYGVWHDKWSGYAASTSISDGYCNIAVIPVQGEIHAYGIRYDEYGNEITSTNMSDTRNFIAQAVWEPEILGIMTRIDSTGGEAVAAETIAADLKHNPLPVAAYIGESGASAAYLIASAADTIIASPFSDVGSIGVTMSYLDYTQQNADMGINFVSLSSAPYKDYGSPDKPMTAEERTLLERDLAIWHDEFVRQVAENRGLPVEYIDKLADGSSMAGKLAREAELVDALGDEETVRAWFAQQLNLTPEEVIFCS